MDCGDRTQASVQATNAREPHPHRTRRLPARARLPTSRARTPLRADQLDRICAPWRFAFLRRAALPSRTADPNASNAQVDGSGTAGTDCASTGFKPAVWYCALDSNTTAPLIGVT